MAPTAGFPTLADSLEARVDLIWMPDNNDQSSPPDSPGPSTSAQSDHIPESEDGDEGVHNNTDVEHSTQDTSSHVDNTELSQASGSNDMSSNTALSDSVSSNTQDATEDDDDVQEILQAPDVPPPSEETLRSQAIAWMEATYSDVPNGEVIQPPPCYAYSRTEHPERPRIWIKDFFTGHVRPRRLVNDRLVDMSRAERERWANQQRRIRGEPAGSAWQILRRCGHGRCNEIRWEQRLK
ncbi:hypothetical protein B0H65DRAFT_428489 [Neurospora tetraspora]|uniref:Uncharacterized protein n=1 Tax=Neurospora tetraspora TaxID=94610 RepID=A0AAE0JBZ6_9PEZI|nr:hypothetical protein B0H65DRAFT_428489 [Neurospora tetraspora]